MPVLGFNSVRSLAAANQCHPFFNRLPVSNFNSATNGNESNNGQ